MTLLDVQNLSVEFSTSEGTVHAVNGLDFTLNAGETLGIVGESGSGKSQTVLSMMRLLAANGQTKGKVLYKGQDLLQIPKEHMNRIRGAEISMIFQDPMTSLNPYMTVGKQMAEVLVLHKGMGMTAALKASKDMLDRVRIPDAANRIKRYPHEFSGGMRQRVMIAMALLCEPGLLIADEPTTALDVTVQAQINELMNELKTDLDTAIILITHDLGVVAGLCDNVLVMYAGEVVEFGTVDDIFYRPVHPYTEGLLKSVPRLDEDEQSELATIPGNPPNLLRLPNGCRFSDRCSRCEDRCKHDAPALAERGGARLSRCYLDLRAQA